MFLYRKDSSETGCCSILASFLRNSVSAMSCLCHSIKHTWSCHTGMCLHCSPHYPYPHKDVHVANKAKSKTECIAESHKTLQKIKANFFLFSNV